MQNPNIDPGFESYRRERTRRRTYAGETSVHSPKHAGALREIEAAEAREVREQQMAREVHEFFESATHKAANIVEKVAEAARTELSERLSQEMQDFLIDALQRMNGLVLDMMGKQPQVAETDVRPDMQNLVGPLLDSFRYNGTAELDNKHIGQDPFDTDPSAVREELLARNNADPVSAGIETISPPELPPAESPAAAIEDHIVAEVVELPPESPQAPPEPAAAKPVIAEHERFKEALKQLVRQGLMTRDEARAAWLAKTQAQPLAH